jgi:SNF2 family DNA or RNA helicase
MTYMHEAMMHRATRALKANVLDLKAPNIQKVPVELSKAHMAAYRSLIKNRYLEVNGTFIDARNVQALRQTALQAACDPDFISEKGSIKENAVVSTVRALLESVGAYDQRKVVLFANYTNTVEMLARVFKNDYNPAVVYGPNGPKKNQDEVYRFQNDGTCRIGIFNPIAGGVGIKAGHVSDVAIFVEPVSTPGQFDQAISRVMLEGQKEPVIAYILKILGTIWPTLIDLMEGKLSDLDEVLRDEKSVFDAFTGRA